MRIDPFGRRVVTSNDLCDQLYRNPDLKLENFLVEDAQKFNDSIKQLHLDSAKLAQYHPLDIDLEEFDQKNQNQWLIPKDYQSLDIEQWLLERCDSAQEQTRVKYELELYKERNLLPLLCFLKYLVDTMRANNIIWGVGRGSSVSSYVLYLIGIHRINSLKFDLNVDEFLR